MQALREINLKVSRMKLQGRRKYYLISHARQVWARYNGRCAHCGLALSPIGVAPDSIRFVHRVPLDAGGKVDSLNLQTACKACAKDRDRKHPLPTAPVIDYNTFGDLIVQLVGAVLKDDAQRVTYFKRTLDLTLATFVQELRAIPIGMEKITTPEPIEGDSAISDLVEDAVKKIALAFEDIALSRRYHPSTRGSGHR